MSEWGDFPIFEGRRIGYDGGGETMEDPMERCAACGAPVREAVVVCRSCGQELPLRVVVVSEGSHGGGFALVVEARPDGERHPAEQRSSRGEPPARPEEEDDGG